MNIHYIQHVPFENLGSMEPLLRERGHQLSATHMYLNETLPSPEAVDWVIVMGGPMGVMDDAAYPFLTKEKNWLYQVINQGKRVLGICLGAQLIAHVLGADIRKNAHREIGWFPITCTKDLGQTILGRIFPEQLEIFHWHGDTFEIPPKAVPLGSSEACKNQGFVLDDRIVGFQFHLETTEESAKALIDHCGDELDGSLYVQSPEYLMADPSRFSAINQVMRDVIIAMESLKA
jgi:GMP synthase-like glutamine amidotransferase